MSTTCNAPFCRLLIAIALVPLVAIPSSTAAVDRKQQSIIILVDRSESIGREPHYQEALINQLLDLSRLTGGRLTLSFIFFGETVEIVGGTPDGLPAPASEPLRQGCADALAKPCAGGTPLPVAIEMLNAILSQLRDENVTVLLLSDGIPSLPLSPQLFPAVKNAMDEKLRQAAKDDDPDAAEKFLNRLDDPNSDEARELYELQYPFVKERCLQLAQATNRFNPRVVSIAFTPRLADLAEIHATAGGSPDDYIETTPHASLRAMYDAGLVNGLISYPVINFPPSPKFQVTYPFDLAIELKAQTILTVQFQPTPQLEKLARTGLQIGGQNHVTDSETSQLSIAHDSEQRLATISLFASSADGGKFGYASPKQELAFPGADLYRIIELPDDLRFICRPVTMEDDTESPFELVQQNPQDFLVGLQWKSGDGVALSGGEVVFKHTETGQQHLLGLHSDSQFANLLVAPAKELMAGTYSVIAHLTLRSGLPITTTLEKHFKVVGEEERIRVDVTESSFSVDRIDFGLLGDAEIDHEVTLKLASDTSFDLPLLLRVTDLKDAEDTAVGDEWVTLVTDDDLILPAGETMDVTFRCQLPEHLPDGVIDGPVQGVVEYLNADTLQPVTIVPAVDNSATQESLQTVRFTLKRPHLSVSAPRAWRDLIETVDNGLRLRVNANVTFPYDRRVNLLIATTSEVDREVTIRLSRSHNDDGSVSETVAFTLDNELVGETITIPAGKEILVHLPFSVAEALERGYGSIVISGVGVQSCVISFDVGSTAENGVWMRWFAWAGFGLLSVASLVFAGRKRLLSRFCRKPGDVQGQRHRPGAVLDLFSFSPDDGKVRLSPIAVGLQIELGLDEARPMDQEESITPEDLVTLRAPDGRAVEITGFSPDGDMCWVKVLSGGPIEWDRTWARRKQRIAVVAAAACCILAIGIKYSPLVIEIVQFTFDALHLS